MFFFRVQAEPQKKLEDFENAASQTLVAKQKNQAKPKCKAKGQPKAKVMKKPSAASNGVTKTVTKPSAKGAEARANCYGCVRCRGVTHGCATCIQPNFGGTILRSLEGLHGRQRQAMQVGPFQESHAFVQGSNSICRAAHLPGGKNNDCLCFLLERMQCPPACSSKHMCFVSRLYSSFMHGVFFPM